MRTKWLKKQKTFFYKRVLQFNKSIIDGLGQPSLGPRVSQVYKVPWWENTPSVMLQGALQRHKNSKQIFPEKEMRRPSPHFHIHVPVCNLYIPRISLPILLQENMRTDPGII